MDQPELDTPTQFGRPVRAAASVLQWHGAALMISASIASIIDVWLAMVMLMYVALSLLCTASLWLAFGPADSGWRQFFFALLLLTSLVWLATFSLMSSYLLTPLLIAVVGRYCQRKGWVTLGFEPDPPRRRENWQFSLKYLFALTAAVAVALLIARPGEYPPLGRLDIPAMAFRLALASLLLLEFGMLGLAILEPERVALPALGLLSLMSVLGVSSIILALAIGAVEALIAWGIFLLMIYGPYAVLFGGSFYLLHKYGLHISIGAGPTS